VLGWTLLAVLAYAALLTVWPFLVPLAWAAVFATVLAIAIGLLDNYSPTEAT
jgi:predicted PurR-regulated permease PerM